MQLSPKQKEFWNEPFHRWNIKHGGTRTGKTYLDYFTIPRRIREREGKDGLIVLLGDTKGTLQRNIVEPMQGIYGVKNISDIKSNNTATIFGEKVYCLGADNIRHADRIRGSSIKYCYGDELTTWNKEVFEMLKSRLDKPYSCFDATCNPKDPKHWVKQFIDSDVDIFSQTYALSDNPFLDEKVRREMLREHTGVFYDRYILGLWVSAEGVVFGDFAADPAKNIITKDKLLKFLKRVEVGFDIGGNKSAYALTCSGIGYDDTIYVLKSKKIQAGKVNMSDIEKLVTEFCESIEKDYSVEVEFINTDHVDVIINSINDNTKYRADKTYKPPIADRPFLFSKLLANRRLLFVKGQCDDLINELCEMIFDDKATDAIPLDDGSMQIDAYDSLTYSISGDWNYLMNEGA